MTNNINEYFSKSCVINVVPTDSICKNIDKKSRRETTEKQIDYRLYLNKGRWVRSKQAHALFRKVLELLRI